MKKCSVCMATYNRPAVLERILRSIRAQHPPFDYEIIVADDGNDLDTVRVCNYYRTVYYPVKRSKRDYHNPAAARNAAYRLAEGEIVIAQSDDVIHQSADTMERLASELLPGKFVVATVINVDARGQPYCDRSGAGYGDWLTVYTSPTRRRPLFFLGALFRRDLYAVGGNDEEFVKPGREDAWFALCLTEGLGLQPHYSTVRGHHLCHPHTTDYAGVEESKRLFRQKLRAARETGAWYSSGGPWRFDPPPPSQG